MNLEKSKKILLSFLLVVVCMLFKIGVLYAQEKTDTLKDFILTAKKYLTKEVKINEFSPGQKIKSIDSEILKQYRLQNLAELLTQQTSAFVKSYGFNSLSTLSFRGASAAQSTVLWNGVPIQNPALGMADISTLPVFFIDRINIISGSSASLWGSGNVGGAILLENESIFTDSIKKLVKFTEGIGSFSQYFSGLNLKFSNRRVFVSINGQIQMAKNDFLFSTLNGKQEKLSNSQLQSNGIQVNSGINLNKYGVLNVYSWFQKYDRQIPPALFESVSKKNQNDFSQKILAEWKKELNLKTSCYLKSSVIKDNTRYIDDLILLNSLNNSTQYYSEGGLKLNFNKFGQMLLFAPLQVAAFSINETEKKQQTKVAIAGAYDIKIFNEKLDLAVNTRLEKIDAKGILLEGASTSYHLFDWINIRVNIQTTYRSPSLNELYFSPGGNINLKPEHGINEDLGYALKVKAGNFRFNQDFAVFNRNIDDWIIWLGGAVWTPHNIASVHSRGTETETQVQYMAGKWRIQLGLNTAYVLATTISSYLPNDGSIGKQIPYAPRYNGSMYVGIVYKDLSLHYIHSYTGYRFITTDESEFLLPYQVGNLKAAINKIIFGQPFSFSVQLNNIWNTQYAVVAYRPMPGVNFLAGVNCQFVR